MKQKLLALIVTLIIVCGVVWTNRASAWTVTIRAVGQDFNGGTLSNVKIGVASEAEAFVAPPPAPQYSVKMELYTIPDWVALWEDIRQEGDARYTWVIGIDPHGNITIPGEPPDAPRTATLIWDPTEFAADTYYKLREGYDETGPIVVGDMRTTTSYDVVGGQGFQFFTVVGVVPIPGTIWLLGSGLIGILGVRRKFKK